MEDAKRSKEMREKKKNRVKLIESKAREARGEKKKWRGKKLGR